MGTSQSQSSSFSSSFLFLFDYVEPTTEFQTGGLIINKIQDKIDPDRTSIFIPSQDGRFVASLQLEQVTLIALSTTQDLHPRKVLNRRWPSVDLSAVAHVCFLKTPLPLPLLVLFPYVGRRDYEYRQHQETLVQGRDTLSFFESTQTKNATTRRAQLWNPNTGMVAPLAFGHALNKASALREHYDIVCWSECNSAPRIAIAYHNSMDDQQPSFFTVYDCSSADVARPEILFVDQVSSASEKIVSLLFSDANPNVLCVVTRDNILNTTKCVVLNCETHEQLNQISYLDLAIFSRNDRDVTLGVVEDTFLVCSIDGRVIYGIPSMNSAPTIFIILPEHLEPLGFFSKIFLVCKGRENKSTHFCRFFFDDDEKLGFSDISCPFLDLRASFNFLVENPYTREDLLVYAQTVFSQAQVRPLDYCWSPSFSSFFPNTSKTTNFPLPSREDDKTATKFVVWCMNARKFKTKSDAMTTGILALLAMQPDNFIIILKIPFLSDAIAFISTLLAEEEQQQPLTREARQERRQHERRNRGRLLTSIPSKYKRFRQGLSSFEDDYVIYDCAEEERALDPSQSLHSPRSTDAVILMSKKTETTLKRLERQAGFIGGDFLYLSNQFFSQKTIPQFFHQYQNKPLESESGLKTLESLLFYFQRLPHVRCTLVFHGHGNVPNSPAGFPETKSFKIADIPFPNLARFMNNSKQFASILQFIMIRTCSTGQSNLARLLPNVLLPFPVVIAVITDSRNHFKSSLYRDDYFNALANMDFSKLAEFSSKGRKYQHIGIRRANELDIRLFDDDKGRDGNRVFGMEITETMAEQKTTPLVMKRNHNASNAPELFLSASIILFSIVCDLIDDIPKILSVAEGDACHVLDSLILPRQYLPERTVWKILKWLFSFEYSIPKVFLVRRLSFSNVIFENMVFRIFRCTVSITCVSARVDPNAQFRSERQRLGAEKLARLAENLFTTHATCFEDDSDDDDDDDDSSTNKTNQMQISLADFVGSHTEIINNKVKNPVYAAIWVENEAIQQKAMRIIKRQRQLLWQEYLLQQRFLDRNQDTAERRHNFVLESLNDISLWTRLLQQTHQRIAASLSVGKYTGDGEDDGENNDVDDKTNRWPLWLKLKELKEVYNPLVTYLYENAKAYAQLEEEKMQVDV